MDNVKENPENFTNYQEIPVIFGYFKESKMHEDARVESGFLAKTLQNLQKPRDLC